MAFEDFELYQGKKVSDLFKDIVKNSENTKTQLELLISDLRPLVKTPADAISLTPVIRDYIESTIKNDDALVKLAAISQRIMSSSQKGEESGDGLSITDEEREELLNKIKEVKDEVSEISLEKKTQPKKIKIEKIEEDT
jgi:hypothetical protein